MCALWIRAQQAEVERLLRVADFSEATRAWCTTTSHPPRWVACAPKSGGARQVRPLLRAVRDDPVQERAGTRFQALIKGKADYGAGRYSAVVPFCFTSRGERGTHRRWVATPIQMQICSVPQGRPRQTISPSVRDRRRGRGSSRGLAIGKRRLPRVLNCPVTVIRPMLELGQTMQPVHPLRLAISGPPSPQNVATYRFG